MIHTIRPYKLFDLIPCGPMERLVTLPIPSRRSADTLTITTLETMLLLAAVKIVNAKSIYEFGTSVGATTLNMAMNSDADITTIDRERLPRDYDGTEYANRITELTCDSHDLAPVMGVADLIFIDGGHDYETVAQDSLLAASMVHSGGCIIWHDYHNPNEPDVTKFINTIQSASPLYHVEDSWMVFWFSEDVRERLL